MAKFRSVAELTTYRRAYTIVTSSHKAILVGPDGRETELPADQVQHYLDKGFRWAEGPEAPVAVPEEEGNVPGYPPPQQERRPRGRTSFRMKRAK